jgi:DNA-binding PucR family transcriptional regulator
MDPDARLHELVARVAADPDWFRTLTDEISERVVSELADVYSESAARDRLSDSVESTLRLLVYMLRDRVPPREARLTPALAGRIRAAAQGELALEHILRGLQIGHGVFLRWWISAAHEAFAELDDLASAVDRATHWTFTYVEALGSLLVRAYGEAHDRWVESGVAWRLETVRKLLSGELTDERAASARLQYDLARRHTAVIVWAGASASSSEHLEGAARSLLRNAQITPPLIISMPGGFVSMWVGDRSRAGERAPIGSFDAAGFPSARAAIGNPNPGIEGFRRTYREALDARRVADLVRDQPVTEYDAVALMALATIDVDKSRVFVLNELGPLAAGDAPSAQLRTTLIALLEEQLSPRRTARRLGVHENTVVNRTRSIQERLPHRLEHRTAELHVALRLLPLVFDP